MYLSGRTKIWIAMGVVLVVTRVVQIMNGTARLGGWPVPPSTAVRGQVEQRIDAIGNIDIPPRHLTFGEVTKLFGPYDKKWTGVEGAIDFGWACHAAYPSACALTARFVGNTDGFRLNGPPSDMLALDLDARSLDEIPGLRFLGSLDGVHIGDSVVSALAAWQGRGRSPESYGDAKEYASFDVGYDARVGFSSKGGKMTTLTIHDPRFTVKQQLRR